MIPRVEFKRMANNTDRFESTTRKKNGRRNKNRRNKKKETDAEFDGSVSWNESFGDERA